MGNTVNIIWMWEKCNGIKSNSRHWARISYGHGHGISASNPETLNKEKGLEKQIKGKNDSIGFFREDNDSHKLLIQEFGLSQNEQNSRVD